MNEEDTVTVGQDLVKMEPGEGGAKPAAKEETKKEDSKPAPEKTEEKQPVKEEKPAPKEEKPAPPKQESKPKEQPKASDSKPQQASTFGSRDERRVRIILPATSTF